MKKLALKVSPFINCRKKTYKKIECATHFYLWVSHANRIFDFRWKNEIRGNDTVVI